MQKLVASTVLFFVLSGIVFSQGKEIKKDEFSQIYYSALDKSREVDRRMDSKLEYYRDGTTTTTEEWLYEYLAPYTRRLVYQKIIDGKTTRIEEVNIDDNNYCRFDDRSWERRSTNCLTGFTALMSQASHQVGGIVSSQFTVEDGNLNGAKAKLYREYTKYRNQAPQNNDGDRLRFLENRKLRRN